MPHMNEQSAGRTQQAIHGNPSTDYHNSCRESNMPIRIGYLVSQYPAVNHTFILREVRQLRKQGIEPAVVSIRPSDRPPAAMTAEEREERERTFVVLTAGVLHWKVAHLATALTRPVGYLRGIGSALRLAGWDLRKAISHLSYFAEAVVAGRWMARHGLAHIHVHFSSTVGLLITRIFPITMSITIHGPDEFNDPAGFHLAEKTQAARFVCAISNYGRSQLMKNSRYEEWGKLEVSPLGVDTATYSARPARRNPSPFEILCVGRLAPAKGQHILVDALDVLVRQGRSVRLRLVGDGPDRPSLQRHIDKLGLRNATALEGWRNQDELRLLYAQTDAFALASFAEGVPVVLMEAMAMEIPCVATRITGVPELIRDGIDGLLVDASDASQLAEAVGRLMDDPTLGPRLGSSARQRVLERYDLTRNTARLADIFRCRLSRNCS
jgi:colanic acid/amylovoran biosynthesis glycosyltransferase